ncbi:VWA domain-containing protein, partial [Nocardioides sp.]|uniref:VWA domain-containing protein n=1 Tax=Nocardioides sp. TaxID=35761 RepID=UPI0027369C01
MTRSLPRLLGGLLVVLSVLARAGGAAAAPLLDDDVAINHVEIADEGIQLLVSVPADTPIDLDRVSVTINGDNAPASARTAADSGVQVRRTTVLAIDTSNSMRGERIAAAKAAASTFLDTAPADVFVGIVTFDSDVTQALAPTRDRAAARAVLA